MVVGWDLLVPHQPVARGNWVGNEMKPSYILINRVWLVDGSSGSECNVQDVDSRSECNVPRC
jgi:hypothetical protein